uniref:Uncharacterized protein n=2 Tax=Nothobranchius furzeri TaxID=105023 RepID=A0A1A7ZQ73_NOTFU
MRAVATESISLEVQSENVTVYVKKIHSAISLSSCILLQVCERSTHSPDPSFNPNAQNLVLLLREPFSLGKAFAEVLKHKCRNVRHLLRKREETIPWQKRRDGRR